MSGPAEYVRVAEVLRQRIDDGVYPVGDVLPSEAQLSVELASSRVTVGRAVAVLRAAGRLSTAQGRRTVVTEPPDDDPGRTLDRRIRARMRQAHVVSHAVDWPGPLLDGLDPCIAGPDDAELVESFLRDNSPYQVFFDCSVDRLIVAEHAPVGGRCRTCTRQRRQVRWPCPTVSAIFDKYDPQMKKAYCTQE